jgi:hypothetical protein
MRFARMGYQFDGLKIKNLHENLNGTGLDFIVS